MKRFLVLLIMLLPVLTHAQTHSATLQWDEPITVAPNSPAVTANVIRNGTKVANVPVSPGATGTTYIDTTVLSGTTYTFGVVNLASDGSTSTEVDAAPVTVPGVPPPPPAFTPVRLKPGTAYTDSAGNAWVSDASACKGGSTDIHNATIAGALPGSSDSALYRTERWNNSSCTITAPAGSYAVTIKFAETSFTGPGKRIFNVTINGAAVLTNFDIFAAAGAMNKAVDKTFTVNNANSSIVINFNNGSVDDATYDAIQVVSSGPPPPPAVAVTIAPTTVTVAQGNSVQFTAAVTGTTNNNVTWSVNAPNGLYTAPNVPGTAIVVATSVADTTKSASAQVTISPLPLTITCNSNASTCNVGGIQSGQAWTVTVTSATRSAAAGGTAP